MNASFKVAILLPFAVLIADRSVAQPPDYGWFLRPAISQEFASLEIGFWNPSVEDPLGLGLSVIDCARCFAFRVSLGVGREESTADLEERVHAEAGIGWERVYLLLGPYFSFGDAARASWGGRFASGFHVNGHFSIEASSEISRRRPHRYTAGALITF